MKKQKDKEQIEYVDKGNNLPWTIEEENRKQDFDDKMDKIKLQEIETIKAEQTFLSYRCIVLDIETTGLKPESERITEIVALRYDDEFNYLGTAFHNLLNPSKKIPEFITELTGITNEMVKWKPLQSDGILSLLKKIDFTTDILVAHNAKFEFDWLVHSNDTFKLASWICTRAIYLYMKDGNTYDNKFRKNYSNLKQVCKHFKVDYNEKEAHRAEYDVLKTAIVAKKMIKKIGIKKCIEISEKFINGEGYGKRNTTKTKVKEVSDVIY